jgi:hypothetical protein
LDKSKVSEAMTISKIKNQWDGDIALKIDMGLGVGAFTLGNKCLWGSL